MKRPAVALTLLAVACGPAVTRVEVLPARVQLDAAGASAQLAAAARDGSGGALDVAVRWESSDPAVAVVDEGGRVTARQGGEALVTGEAAGRRGQARVTVSIPARASLHPPALILVGASSSAPLGLQVSDTLGNPVAPRDVRWRSSDEQVAQVAGGMVRAVGPGKARIEAAVGGLTASADVEVLLPAFARLRAIPARLALRPGMARMLRAEAVDAAGRPVDGVPVIWASSAESVVRVDPQGMAMAQVRGKARVLAIAGAQRAAVEVTVR